jgi:hypothetical protein
VILAHNHLPFNLAIGEGELFMGTLVREGVEVAIPVHEDYGFTSHHH